MRHFIFLFLVSTFLSTVSNSQQVLVGKDIKNIVNEWASSVGINLEVMISTNRAYFACKGETKVYPKSDDDPSMLIFQCREKDNPWEIYIRTKILNEKNEQSITSEKIVIARSPIKKGSVISIEDLDVIDTDGKNNFLFFSQLEDVVGRKAKRTIYRNQKIKPQHVSEIWLVQKDQPVVLVNKIGRIVVETDGIALESGQKNDTIKVKNSRSGQVVSGVVISKKNISVLTKMN
jgi:flagella basal body P-ring formation protein FlgA